MRESRSPGKTPGSQQSAWAWRGYYYRTLDEPDTQARPRPQWRPLQPDDSHRSLHRGPATLGVPTFQIAYAPSCLLLHLGFLGRFRRLHPQCDCQRPGVLALVIRAAGDGQRFNLTRRKSVFQITDECAYLVIRTGELEARSVNRGFGFSIGLGLAAGMQPPHMDGLLLDRKSTRL